MAKVIHKHISEDEIQRQLGSNKVGQGLSRATPDLLFYIKHWSYHNTLKLIKMKSQKSKEFEKVKKFGTKVRNILSRTSNEIEETLFSCIHNWNQNSQSPTMMLDPIQSANYISNICKHKNWKCNQRFCLIIDHAINKYIYFFKVTDIIYIQ